MLPDIFLLPGFAAFTMPDMLGGSVVIALLGPGVLTIRFVTFFVIMRFNYQSGEARPRAPPHSAAQQPSAMPPRPRRIECKQINQ